MKCSPKSTSTCIGKKVREKVDGVRTRLSRNRNTRLAA